METGRGRIIGPLVLVRRESTRNAFTVVAAVLAVVAAFEAMVMLGVAGYIGFGEAPPPPTSAPAMPPSGATARGDLEASTRRGEFVDVERPGSAAPIRTWVVHPERSDPAPVVLIVHDTYRLSDWVRAVADRFAAEGFVVVAPDLMTGVAPEDRRVSVPDTWVVPWRRIVTPDERTSLLDAVRTWALGLPNADGRLGAVGFGWGGTAAFAYAVDRPGLDAAVVFYGALPGDGPYARINAPVMGLYGGRLDRVNATIPRTREAMAAAGKSFETIVYAGATVFLKAQEGLEANRRAAADAWPRTLAFLREHLED